MNYKSQSAPLSKSQYGLYVECVNHTGEACYNLPYIYVLDKSLDINRLRQAVETAVWAHPTLFTRIKLNDDGEPIQAIDLDNEQWSLQVEHIDDIEAVKPQLTVPFNIVGDRLFHIRLMQDAQHIYLFLDYHHIIVDGTSMQIMLQDIDRAYRGETIEPEALTMAQVATSEAEERNSPAFEQAKQWYAYNFNCSDTFTQIIPDREDPVHSEDNQLRILGTDMRRVEDFCKQHGVFKSTLFTTAFAVLLAKFNNEGESLFTTVYNGRSDKRFGHSVGMTVKTLPVYTKFTPDTPVLDCLMQAQQQMSGCREHEIYSYSDVVTDLKLQTNAMFAWHAHLATGQQHTRGFALPQGVHLRRQVPCQGRV